MSTDLLHFNQLPAMLITGPQLRLNPGNGDECLTKK